MAVPNQRRIKKAALRKKEPAKPTSLGGNIRRVTAKPKPRARPVPGRAAASAPAPAGVAPAASPATAPGAGAPSRKVIDEEFRRRFSNLSWAIDHPELGPLYREAIEKGYNEQELQSRLSQTQWFRDHGMANIVAEIRERADPYLVRLTDDDAKRWGMQIVTGQVQPGEFVAWAREQAKLRYPTLAAAIDSGVSVKQYASQYVTDAANELGLAPDAIDLNDPKWGRVLEGQVDPKTGQRAAMTRFDWIRTLKTDSLYGYDLTPKARQEAAQFVMKLDETFGRR